MASPSVAPAKVHYPSSDGRPMAESDFQRTPLTYAVDRLRHHFRGRRDVYVSGNLLLYYQKGNPRAAVAPDVFVVLGVSNADRSGADVVALRRFVGLTQVQFATAVGISVHTLRNWEQDRRRPEGPALALLRIAARHPRVIRENTESVA